MKQERQASLKPSPACGRRLDEGLLPSSSGAETLKNPGLRRSRAPTTQAVRPEPVEGLPFFNPRKQKASKGSARKVYLRADEDARAALASSA